MRKAPVVALAAAMLITAFPAVAHADPPKRTDPRLVTTPKVKIDPKVLPRLVDPDKTVKVIVELKDDPVAVVQAKQGGTISSAQKKKVTDNLRSKQSGVASKVRAKGGKVQSQMQSAYNGMQVSIKATDVNAIAADPAVKAVHAVPTYRVENAESVPFTGAREVWLDTGYTGQGIKVAVIDTGIDYTHADFGGPGTTAAFDTATASNTPNPAWFGPNAPRVKGGIDLVGDDYDANDPNSVPKPDANPIDCEGHGTHVAGTAAGGGVTTNGDAYSGPYNGLAPLVWQVGPGMAPQADLYAIKVFGCEGSTNVTTEAIDWAVANGMDVINMSLGSSYGRADDPSAAAASNAVAAGVVVVASAGNSGPQPYLTGSPASGAGVISVAAMDSTESFPGATINLGSSTVQAINANAASLPSEPFKVVVLTDDPATGENEALGCSVNAFTHAGITTDPAAPPVLAVTTRGTCARVARAVFGQQAGADAVAMINTSPDYPPFEGIITENPDTGAPFDVTIPFLGVRGVLGSAATDDGDALVAAAGKDVTLEQSRIDNPGYTAFASFSSSGPVTGSSALRPSVAAPGVSIVSAKVGSGNGSATNSGTSMAAPHVAGAAALVREAHPTWTSWQISDAIVTTADPSGLKGYSVTLGGAGLLDVRQAVKTQSTLSGDPVRTESGKFNEPALSFGFQQFAGGYRGQKQITITNHSSSAQTYRLINEAAPGSKGASVSVYPSSVTVAAGATQTVKVTMWAYAYRMGTSVQNDGTQAKFNQVSGSVVATLASGEKFRVPYLMVPRASSDVRQFGPSVHRRHRGGSKIWLTNWRTQVPATADVYTWGFADPRGDAGETQTSSGYDVRAAGVQSFMQADDGTLVFAVNTWSRFSNAASVEFDIAIDTTGDGVPDRVVFAVDQGLVVSGYANGITGVFVLDLAGGAYVPGSLRSTGYLAVAPTDSSTVLMPVDASDLGLTPTNSAMTYTVSTYTTDGTPGGDVTGVAAYDPWHKALSDGQFATIGAGRWTQIDVAVSPELWAGSRPLGLMVVVFDNRAGPKEALLFRARGAKS